MFRRSACVFIPPVAAGHRRRATPTSTATSVQHLTIMTPPSTLKSRPTPTMMAAPPAPHHNNNTNNNATTNNNNNDFKLSSQLNTLSDDVHTVKRQHSEFAARVKAQFERTNERILEGQSQTLKQIKLQEKKTLKRIEAAAAASAVADSKQMKSNATSQQWLQSELNVTRADILYYLRTTSASKPYTQRTPNTIVNVAHEVGITNAMCRGLMKSLQKCGLVRRVVVAVDGDKADDHEHVADGKKDNAKTIVVWESLI
eukprot:PhM_4_TR5328/c2_g1_i1/m.21791